MADSEVAEGVVLVTLAQLMRDRHSGHGLPVVPATQELVVELNREITPFIPSGGALRTIQFVYLYDGGGTIGIACRDIRPVEMRYGVFAHDLVLQEAGFLAGWATLYLMEKGFNVRYVQNTGRSDISFMVCTLVLSARTPKKV